MNALIRLLRPHQWTKNVFCLAGLFFGERLGDWKATGQAILITVIFCVASSAVYILNDLKDVEHDRQHPEKCLRPLPQGQVSVPIAKSLAAALTILSLLAGYFCGTVAWMCIASYFIVNVLYTFWLKGVVLLDVSCISLGFMLRLFAGVYALQELPTPWIILCTGSLTLFLGFSKRRCELSMLDSTDRTYQRPALRKYTIGFLDSMMDSSATMAVMCYGLFTVTSGKNTTLVLTVPIVYYGVMRYNFLVRTGEAEEDPDKVLIRDRNIKLAGVLWLLSYLGILYGHINIIDK